MLPRQRFPLWLIRWVRHTNLKRRSFVHDVPDNLMVRRYAIRKFLRAAGNERRLIVEALIWLGVARLAVITLPFRWIASTLGTQNNSAPTLEKNFSLQVHQIALALRRVSPYTLWTSNCLAQAIAGRAMLRRRLITSTIYFGVAKNATGQLEAHAWLRSGAITLTGDGELDRFAVVAQFTDKK